MSKPFCRICLLEDLDTDLIWIQVKKMIDRIPEEEKTEEKEYKKRIDACLLCEKLNEGTCGECGCYVELRAANKNNHCPLVKNRW